MAAPAIAEHSSAFLPSFAPVVNASHYMPRKFFTLPLLFAGLLCFSLHARAQRYLAGYDSTIFLRDTLRPLINRFQHLAISGYMQPQFQLAQQEAQGSYEGGDFAPNSRSRFLLRRARIKLDYVLPSKEQALPAALFTFQIDATERGVVVRDMFLRLFEPSKQNLSLTMGLFGRPFGYEVNLSSSYRETPERGRMSQILLPSERDMGAMLTYEAQKPERKGPRLKLDAGLFNGVGPRAVTDFDSYKDVISRLSLKEWAISRSVRLSGGLSFLNGGWRQDTKYRYETAGVNGVKMFTVDSSLSNLGAKTPRHYYGADVQLALLHGLGKTEWRAEYWRGSQPGTANTTVSPATQPEGPTYVRRFDGAFFYFLQSLAGNRWELMLKYDWYDPNRLASAADIGKSGTNFTAADIKYNTLGLGLTRYFSGNLKILAYYAFVRNEKTALAGYGEDVPDDVFTLRMQLRF